MKYQLYILLMLGRGMRPSEILAINKTDFSRWKQGDYSRLTYREAKTNKFRVNEYIVRPVALFIRMYIDLNNLKDGFLFPFYSSKGRDGRPFMDVKTMGAWFSKIRKQLGRQCPEFIEMYPNGLYRIREYSLRHYFETFIYNASGHDEEAVREIMEYSKKFHPTTYLHAYYRESEKDNFLEANIGENVKEIIKEKE